MQSGRSKHITVPGKHSAQSHQRDKEVQPCIQHPVKLAKPAGAARI
jgi:hypothetical protein